MTLDELDGNFKVVDRPNRTIKPPQPRLLLKNGRMFPHPIDRIIDKMPHNQRFEVTWKAPLGPWGAKGVHGRDRADVIERHIDLLGSHLPTLLGLGAIRPTNKPAYKHPRTIANLQVRVAALKRAGDIARGVASQVKAPITNAEVLDAPIPGVTTGKTTG